MVKTVYIREWRSTMFLDAIDISDVRAAIARREMSNWVKVAERIYSVEDELMLLTMLKVEVTTKNREYIVSRLYSRFSAIRNKREKRELEEWSNELRGKKKEKKTQKST